MRLYFIAGIALLCACSTTSPSNPDGGMDTVLPADGEPSSADARRKKMAKVFSLDPVTTPAPIEVELSGLADDVSTLTSAADPSSLRRFKVLSCVDEGATANVPGAGTQRVCTLKQLADRKESGSFVYDDFEEGVKGVFDPDDRFAEVSLYHHAQRIYDFVTSPEVGVFTHLPLRHDVGGKIVPIILVANYRKPGTAGLRPADVAFYTPREFGAMGLHAMNGLQGIEGDVLAFGQGKADFAYSGQTIYHEFGHLIVMATAEAYHHSYPDSQGLCHLTNALHEGLADTFAVLVSGRPQLNAYLSKVSNPGFARSAENQALFPRDISGGYIQDGQIVLGANYEVLSIFKGAGLTARDLTRVLLKTLQGLAKLKGQLSFKVYAEGFLKALAADGKAAQAGAVKQVFQKRGLLDDLRVKDITSFDGTDPMTQSLFIGGTNPAYGSSFEAEVAGKVKRIAPAYIQTYVDVPPGAAQVTVQVLLSPDPGGALDCTAYLRKGKPVAYDVKSAPAQVEMDSVLAPVITKKQTPMGPMDLATWTLKSPEPGARYYLHFVNRSAQGGVLLAIWVK